MIRRLDRQQPLASELAWFIRLRWIAGSVVALSGALEFFLLQWRQAALCEISLGLIVLFYNAVLFRFLSRVDRPSRALLLRLALAQMLLDLVCLSLLVSWTAGLHSPILGFFVFHMVFASLLLPRRWAYGAAFGSIALLLAGLALSDQWPQGHADLLLLAGFVLTLLMTVALTNHITRDQRRQRRRLRRQNRRIRAISRKLWRHERAMVQQEKIVALGQMAAGIAHEVMNPLANMDSLLQLAQQRPERMNAQNIVKLREQISRINSTIHQMRSLVHPDEGGVQKLTVNDVVKQSLEMVRIDGRARRVGIEAQLGEDVGQAVARQQSLGQVLINLMLNSLDAIAEVPEPKLIVRTSRREPWCIIEVVDNGGGIAPQHLNRIFEPFFTTKPVGKGTGLGLSISHNLIQKMGGTIKVASEVGEGTTMTILLPSVPAAAEPTATVATTK
jgi:signal transduction histidine kinase